MNSCFWINKLYDFSFPGGLDGKESLQCGRPGFDPSGVKIPWKKGMPTHSSIPAWRIPMDKEPGGLQAMRSQRIGQDWATKNSTWLQER